ncbi:hypothetical protein [Pseudoalteromonas piratica]|uniref:Uncharacterized protein n=1 Tax=Pseudoalteromonas piratica TaxID=1348114 RepID=A0A0A7ECK5_9GAMM|nr:hypothetical protein [Pseudoalteromonas piratica]AIY63826.1 hypothetical protein OM33_00575 [Pseudoalteromonas piratica]
MSKSENTKLELLNAIERILSGNTIRIDAKRGLSIIAVEEEANLGNGSAYYYKDVIKKIKLLKSKTITKKQALQNSDVTKLREKLANEKRIKAKYRNEITSLKEQMSLMAATHNALALSNHQFLKKINDLEAELNLIKSRNI